MKRFFAIASILALLSACTEKPEPTPGPDPVPEGFTIAGKVPTDFRIVYNAAEEDEAGKPAALEIRTALKERGFNVDISSSTTAERPLEIIVGHCGRKIDQDYYSFKPGDIFDWKITVKDGKVLVAGANSWGLKGAAQMLCQMIRTQGSILDDYSLSGNCRKTNIFEQSIGTNLRIFDWNIWQYDSANIPEAFYSSGNLLYDPRNANRAKDFGAVIHATSPDVFGFQEYSSKMHNEFIKYYAPKFAQVTTASSTWSCTPLFYDPAKVTLKKAEYYLFAAPWSNSNSKSFTIALFHHKASMKDFIVVCTHLWWKSESAQAGSNQARLDQANQIISKTREWMLTYDVPVFVMGDMNCNLSSDAMKAFITEGYKSVAQEAPGHTDGSRGYHACSESGFAPETADQADKTKNGTTAIDHIWYKNCGTVATVRDYWIIHTDFTLPMSDHAPRFVDVLMK